MEGSALLLMLELTVQDIGRKRSFLPKKIYTWPTSRLDHQKSKRVPEKYLLY